jgi:hypothetical protein
LYTTLTFMVGEASLIGRYFLSISLFRDLALKGTYAIGTVCCD